MPWSGRELLLWRHPVTGTSPFRPRLEAAFEVAWPLESQVSQGGCGEARGVTLGADHDHLLEVVPYRRQTVRGVGIEPPLEDIALHHECSGKWSFYRALMSRPYIYDDATAVDHILEIARCHTADAFTRVAQQVADRLGQGSASPRSQRTVSCASRIPSMTRYWVIRVRRGA